MASKFGYGETHATAPFISLGCLELRVWRWAVKRGVGLVSEARGRAQMSFDIVQTPTLHAVATGDEQQLVEDLQERVEAAARAAEE